MRTRQQHPTLMGAIWLGLLSMGASGTSVADPAQAPYTRCAGKMASLVVAGKGNVEILVARERLTSIVFPRPVEKEGDGTEAIEIYTLDPDTLLVRPKTHARSDSTVTVEARTNISELNLRVRVVDDPALATTSVLVIENEDSASVAAHVTCSPLDSASVMSELHSIQMGKLSASYQQQIDTLEAELNATKVRNDELETRHQHDQHRLALEATEGVQRRILAEAIRARENNALLSENELRGKRGVFISDPGWDTVAGNHLLHFTIYNNDPREFRVRSLRAFDELAEQDFATQVKFGSRAEPMDGTTLATIAPYSHVEAAISVKPFLSSSHLMLFMSESNGERTITSEPIRHWKWEFPPEGNEDLLTLSIKALGGAIWLSDGLGLGELGTTSFQGAGVRVTYGVSKLVNIEVEAAGASTGEACIEDVDYKGMQGELVRSATIGRLNMGGLLRFGSGRFLPTMRLGVGLQGSSQSRRLVGSGGETMLDEDGIEVSVSIGGGVGVDIRLVNGFYLGTGISLEQHSDGRAFEAAINLGYAWMP